MTDKRAFQLILQEQQCVKNRLVCDKDCRNCIYYPKDVFELYEAITYCCNILKARNPELYFANELDQLKEALASKKPEDRKEKEDETESKEAR